MVRSDYPLICAFLRTIGNSQKIGLIRESLYDAADTIDALAKENVALKAKKSAPKVEMELEGPFNKATVYRDCAVQVCENTHTGVTSVAWTKNPEIIEKWEAEEYENGEMEGGE